MRIALKILIILFPVLLYAFDNNTIYEEGLNAYRKGQYDLAIQRFESIISNNWESAELYYNLGNAFYRKSNISGAVWAYESCLKLSPTHEDANYNLKLTNLKVVDKIDFPLPPFYLSWYLQFKNLFTLSDWLTISIFILLLISITLLFFKIYLILPIKYILNFLIIIFFSSSFITFHSLWILESNKFGVIYAKAIEVKSEPNEYSTYLFKVHEGLKVSIQSIIDDWIEIELIDGKKGWVSRKEVRLIN